MANENEMTLDDFDQQITNYKLDDFRKKMDIAANIVKQCKMNKGLNTACKYTKTSVLTGVPLQTIVVINSLQQKFKRFAEWFMEQKTIRHVTEFSYKCLRRELTHSYLEWRQIAANLKEKKSFSNNCFKKYFTSIKVPNTKSSIVAEKPEYVMERQRFLYKKMMYREMNKNIVYIGKINILATKGKFSYKEDNSGVKSRFFIAVSPTYGHMSYLYCSAHTYEYLTNWIQERVLPDLPPESVIIFQENLINPITEPINSFSSKEDMINWLCINEIPHERKMHKADLYKLIKENERTVISKFYKPEEILRANGHIPIRKKMCNINYNFFDPFWEFFIHELNTQMKPFTNLALKNHSHVITQTANVVVQNAPLDYWKGLENLLQEREEELYREDREMEYVIDKFLTMAKYEGLPAEGEKLHAKLDEYSETMEKDYMFLADFSSLNE